MVSFPNAKINLGLYVTERRPDGYHNISTVFLPVGWSDILEITPSRQANTPLLTVTGNKIDCPSEKNLVIKALKVLESYLERTFDINIFLRKIIPDGAGLGGGSSNAAFVVKMLNEIYELNLSPSEMKAIISPIGADCAFFIENTPVIASGIGDIMRPVKVPINDWKIFIVKPPFYMSTPEAYGLIKPSKPLFDLEEAIHHSPYKWRETIFNDFEKAAISKFPELDMIKEQLYQAGAIYASMSGSGTAFYGLFEPRSDNMAEICRYFSNKNFLFYYGTLHF